MNATLLLDVITMGLAPAYGLDCIESNNQVAIEKNKERDPAIPKKSTDLSIQVFAGHLIQGVAATLVASETLQRMLGNNIFEGAEHSVTAKLAFMSFIGLSMLSNARTTNKANGFFQKKILPIADSIGTITHTVMIVCSLAYAYFSSSLISLTFGTSLLYGLADRAKLINPTVSKVVDWTRFALSDTALFLAGWGDDAPGQYCVVALTMLIFKLLPTLRPPQEV